VKRLAALALLVSLAACETAPPAPTLEGRWKTSGSKVYFSDGTTLQQTFACSMTFTGAQAISECTVGGTTQRMVRTNREIAPRRIESEIVEDSVNPRNVGRRSQIDYRFEGDSLITTAHPPPPKEGTARYPIRIEALWTREPMPR